MEDAPLSPEIGYDADASRSALASGAHEPGLLRPQHSPLATISALRLLLLLLLLIDKSLGCARPLRVNMREILRHGDHSGSHHFPTGFGYRT
jgi:hypothetical protein